jgi:hypothetical protein
MHVLGGRLVIHHAILWYTMDKGYRNALVPVYQAGDPHSIRGNMTIRVSCCAIYTKIPLS